VDPLESPEGQAFKRSSTLLLFSLRTTAINFKQRLVAERLKACRDRLYLIRGSLTYGLVMTALIMLTAWLTWQYGSVIIMMSMLFGVVFLAPLACIGTYAISAQIEGNQTVSLMRVLQASFKGHIGNQLVFTLVLLVIFLLWARASSMVSIFLPSTGEYSLESAGSYLVTLSVVSFIFLGISFTASVFALPMIMHRDVDTITAVLTSINAELRNKLPMLTMAGLIALLVLLGMATAGIGLIIFLPAIGHAVWHGYLETIDASEFPLHKAGITATRRTPQ
jgi:uncharacterized membrane protein